MQEINVLHVCLIFTTIKENTNEDFKFSLKWLLLRNYCMWNLFLACAAYSNFTRTRVHVADLFFHFVLGFCWEGWTSLVRIPTNNHKKEVENGNNVKSIVEIRTRVNSAAKVSYQQVYSSDLYTSINRRIQTEWPPVSACFSLSQPQNTQKKIQRMVIKLGFLMLRTIVTTFCFWQGPNLRPSAC